MCKIQPLAALFQIAVPSVPLVRVLEAFMSIPPFPYPVSHPPGWLSF